MRYRTGKNIVSGEIKHVYTIGNSGILVKHEIIKFHKFDNSVIFKVKDIGNVSMKLTDSLAKYPGIHTYRTNVYVDPRYPMDTMLNDISISKSKISEEIINLSKRLKSLDDAEIRLNTVSHDNNLIITEFNSVVKYVQKINNKTSPIII